MPVKLVLDDELARCADLHGPTSAEAYVSNFVKLALRARAYLRSAILMGATQSDATNDHTGLARSQRRYLGSTRNQ